MIDDYFEAVRALIAASLIVRASRVSFERRSEEIGFLRGDLFLVDGSILHFREYVRQSQDAPAQRYTYAYHYQRSEGTLIFRYDNTEHFPELPNFPHHKHVEDESSVSSANAPDLATVLHEIGLLVGID